MRSRFCPPAPIPSPSAAMARNIPIPTRRRAPGSDRTRRPRERFIHPRHSGARLSANPESRSVPRGSGSGRFAARPERRQHKEDPMNTRSNPDTTLPAVTTGPLPSSRKIFCTPDEAPDLRVPLREIILSEGAGEPNLAVYDTSGPYTDPNVTIDVNKGLPRNRSAWVKERGGVEEYEGRA